MFASTCGNESLCWHGLIHGLGLYRGSVAWKKAIPDGTDKLASSPDERLLFERLVAEGIKNLMP
jgi:hypothetical protein